MLTWFKPNFKSFTDAVPSKGVFLNLTASNFMTLKSIHGFFLTPFNPIAVFILGHFDPNSMPLF